VSTTTPVNKRNTMDAKQTWFYTSTGLMHASRPTVTGTYCRLLPNWHIELQSDMMRLPIAFFCLDMKNINNNYLPDTLFKLCYIFSDFVESKVIIMESRTSYWLIWFSYQICCFSIFKRIYIIVCHVCDNNVWEKTKL